MLNVLLTLFATLIGAGLCQDLFYFTKHPAETTTVAAGSPVTLECEISHPDIINYWSVNGKRVPNSSRRHTIGRNLFITRADHVLDVGEYACIAENATTGYSLTSRTAKLDVAWIGNASVSSSATGTIHELVLRCNVGGSNDIKYSWFKNGKLLSRNERISMRPFKPLLTIHHVSPADNGVYTCSCSNPGGTAISANNYVLRLRGKFTPNVSIVPESLVVPRGGVADFNCLFEAADEVNWFLNDIRVSADNRIFLHQNGSITIKDVEKDDEGIWKCSGIRKRSDNIVDIETYSANLTLAYLDNLTEDYFEPRLSGPVVVIPIHIHAITCLAPKGVPTPDVTWIDPLTKTRIGPILGLEIVKSGVLYTCIAENLADRKQHSVYIYVSVPPRVTRETKDLVIEEGSTLRLGCSYQGSPSPASTFSWHRDGRLIDRHLVTKDGELVIPSIQPADRGSYVCQINTTGFPPVNTAATHVVIREILKFSPRPVEKKIELGSVARVHCKAQGTPTPVIRWVKGTKDNNFLPKHLSVINGTLVFRNASMSDKGFYTCIASNSEGSIEATINIDVSVAPWFTIAPKNITEVLEGFPAAIHCMAEGDPHPFVNWDKDGDVDGLDKTRFHILDNGTLVISVVYRSDVGHYGCTAGNSGGLKRMETELIIRGADDLETDLEEEESMMTRTVIITLSAAAGYMALVIGLMVWCRYRRRKRKQAYLNENPEGILLAKAENGEVRNDTDGKRLTERLGERQCDGAEAAHSQSSGHSRRSGKAPNYDKILVPRQNLRDLKLIGHGIFGQVFIGHVEPTKKLVLVKSLQNTRDEITLAEFKRELDMFHRLAHENVSKLVGLCRESDPHYLILEYTDWGDLKQFLESTRKERTKLSTNQLLTLAKQASLGMEHLSNARYIHRDLAARNCLVSSDLQLKISALALSRDVHNSDYTLVRNQKIPLRWSPAEVVFDDDYSTKSDVYSFAVLCWEIFHQGDKPFANLNDEQLMERLEKRELVVRPSKHVPAAAANVLVACAAPSPKDRPTFSSIAIALCEVLADL